ncbi:DUF5801 repeats-in-toxin domain-containing protein [Pseudomonas lopnurensis]|uniref:DUF5801 repeats-in-toxin domain-containing protein n=1 Tax=Pseudomonas lopnurensis TaxID=1477517 RepID=UPI001A9C620C|nr:DUF5801 repeats-in-toxin domain-containing protein [Pseudomonas lopnurensis]
MFESGLTNGSSPSPNDTVVNASFTVSALDGLDDSDAVTIDYTDASGDPASLTLSKAQVEALGGAPQSIITRYGTLELNGYNLGGDGVITLDYRYTLVNAPEVSGDHTSDTFAITATDRGGDDHSQNLSIRIVDDVPQASADTDSVAAGQYSAETGNVISGAGTTSGSSSADVQGADGATITAIASDNVPANDATNDDGTLTIQGQYGTLVIEPSGDYSYTRAAGTPGGVDDVFSYTLTDADGDPATATLTISIADATPTIGGLTPQADGGELTFHERYLADGTTPDDDELTKTGDFTITSPDGVKSLVIDGVTVIADGALTSSLTVSTGLGNTLTITGYDPDTGVVTYSYALGDNQTHTQPSDNTELFENIALVLTDQDDQTASGTLGVRIVDDVPVVTDDAGELGSVTVDETTLGTPATDSDFVADVFGVNYGADGAASSNPLVYALNVASAGVVAGVIDTANGQGVYLYKVGHDIVGRVGNGGSADPAGAEAFRIEIDATTGAVTLTQSRPLSHPDADDHDDPLSLASDAITLTATATDGDGDATTSTAVDVGGRFTFLDDGPGISAAPTGATIDEANLANGSEPDVPLTSVSHSLNVQFGADGAGDVQFTGDTSAALEGLGLESNGEGLTYDITGGGHTLTAYRGDVADGIPVFTVVIINPGTTPAYQFTLLRPLDHIDGTGAPIDDIALDFVGILVTDRDGDTVETQFTVTVLDDTPDDTQPKQVTIDEDSTAAVPANTFNTNADATGSNTTIGYGDNGTMAPAHGTAMVNPDGTITYVPHGNYSGTDTFTYTTVTDNETKTFTVEVTVDPVADAPDMDGDGPSTGGDVVLTAVDTPEDTAVTLGLKAPIVTDAFDGNGASAGDASEKLSLVTLSGVPAGARLLAELDGASAAIDFTASGGDIGILLSDGDHMTGLSGQTLTMTRAQFEQLQLLPPTESHQNISLTVRVTSYEVDDAGARAQVGGVDVPGAEAIATLAVYVQAVTDPIDLRIHDGVDYVDADTSGSAVTLPSFEEDTSIDLKDYLQITLDEATDGNTGADVDGSEERWFEVTGLPVGWAVNDITITAEDQVVRVDIANGYNGVSPTLPDIIIEPPKDFSGDLDDVRVTLHAQDRDSDGVGSGATTGAPVSDTVHLNLRVDPVAGDVEVEGASGLEDTAIAFLGGIAVTDTSTGASGEIITGVSFRVPAGWTVSADGASWTHATLGTWTVSVPANTADWSLSVDTATGSYTLAGAAGFDLKPILDAFTATPPAHSSRDLTLQDVTVTTVDSNTVGGTSVTSVPATTSPVTLLIEVTPVAEQEDADTADPGGNDVTHNDDHTYMAPGEEDSWFVLGQEGVFNLKTGWANEDGDEETYALLTPKLIFGDSLAEAGGSQFRYSTNGDTTDAGGEWTTLTYDGSNPVEIPMEYLDTLQFKAANNFSGKFEIDVRIRTVDYDDDNEGDGTPSVYTSDDVVATLDNILILPVADQVTLAVHGLAKGDEDTRIPLTIEPRSDDPSETYTVVIKDIPAGAKLFYGDDPDTALELTIVGDTATIENFDSGTLLTVRPPVDGNTDFTLTVEARSVDTMPNLDNPAEPYVRESPIETKNIQVQVKGVADGFDLQTESNKTYTESAVDGAMNNRVPLSELITGHTPRDTDGSETLNLKITLPAGFSLEGGTWLGDAWLLDASQLATASIRVPEHFSGEVIVGVAVISTEIDGHSISEPTSVTFTITPEVEKTMQDSSALLEDTRGQVQFAIPGGGDTKETLTSVWVDVDDVASGSADYTLYYGSSGSMTLAEAANDPGVADVVLDDGWYKLSGSAIGNVYAQGAANSTGSHDFGVQYTIINTASEGPATDTSTISDTHTLNIAPATDPATLIITGITSSNADNADINDTAVEVTGNTTLTIDFQLTKNPDANAGGARDHDGSERLTGLVIEGVPQGVTIVGASYIGNVPGGGAGSENTGRWLLPIDQAIDQAADGTTFSIEFELLAAADILAGLNDTLTVTAITQDGSAEEVSASASWTLTTPADTSDFEDTDVSATEPVEIVGWTVDNMAAPGVEDAGFQLGSVVQGSLDGSGPFAITITGFTGGSIEGMTETMVNGEPTWTLYGSGDSAGLQALLDSIGITPPGDRNDNGSTPWSFDVTLTTYAPNGERNVVTQSVTPPLAPATDPAAVTVTTNGVTEGDAVTFTVKVAPGVDGEFSRVVDGKLYLRLNEAGGLASGSLTGPDGELDLQAVAGVDGLPDGDYYIIEDVGFGDEVILTYQGGEHAAGQVSLTAGFLTREEGADVSDIRPGFGSVTAVVAPENSGIDFTDENGVSIDALVATGTEDQRVELRVSGALNDQDGSEELLAAFLRHVPTDFLVFVGSDADSAKLANNAGGGIWSIPLTGGALPAYIAVQPPRNWSGTASDLELVVQASDQGLASEDFTLPVTLEVAPVADGISISPTLTFGTEGNIIPINLNAAMPDNDGSELATLAFQGLGKYAAFYAGATLLDADSGVTVTYVEATDTHTVSGLTPQQVNTLGFVQAAGSVAGTVQVTAYTVDGTDSTEGAPSSGSFEVAIAAKPATGGHDVLLYGGAPIDGLGGDDTIQLRFGESLSGDELAGSLSNIEIIDMSGAGQNSIVGLGIEDVLGMTDSRNTLRILGDESDTITLDAGWGTGVVDGDYVLYSVTQGAETIRLEVASVLVD